MTDSKSTFTVTTHWKNGECHSQPHEAVDEKAAVEMAASNLSVQTDDKGNVIGDAEIFRITAVPATKPKLHHQ